VPYAGSEASLRTGGPFGAVSDDIA